VKFEIVAEIEQAETIASGGGVGVRSLLGKVYGRGRWRKAQGRDDRAARERQTPPS
jgi:hypothetical protein